MQYALSAEIVVAAVVVEDCIVSVFVELESFGLVAPAVDVVAQTAGLPSALTADMVEVYVLVVDMAVPDPTLWAWFLRRPAEGLHQ